MLFVCQSEDSGESGHMCKSPILNTHADISYGARGLNYGLSLHLHPYFVRASSEGFGESGRLCKSPI